MTLRIRTLARLGAAALLASGAFAAVGSPAQAAGTQTDLELSVVGTTLAPGSEGKLAWAKIANNGPNTPRTITLTADVSALDTEKVVIQPAAECVNAETKITCDVAAEDIPGPGETLELPVFVFKGENPTVPYTASVTFTISSPDDTTPDNNSKTVDVTVSDQSGVDLGVVVADVKDKRATPADEPGAPLHAGDTTIVFGYVVNWGDMIANGVKVTVQLPEHVTFAEVEDACDYTADNRTATCKYESLVLNPTSESFVAEFFWPIKVGADVQAPIILKDGSWTVEALAQAPIDAPTAKVQSMALPHNVRMLSANEAGVTEVDASDNVDGFAVVVAATGGGGGGTGGGLPVTGAQLGLVAAGGIAALALGAVLLLVARRRRVVLVTPDDEGTTA